ncbi:hypothetical protein [Azospirillum sp. B4]|uniref:hypothetical protein n=1 Tax=Azospirillum sp. B4 TaxID=95605 RepID=UPI00034DFF00|nr:hypothetical protein [Azospirillum sp. B4]
MTVSIANKLIQGRGGLSDVAALALAFIDGGVEWLAWATGGATAPYNFPDETTMLSQVQQGLHASPLAFLPVLGLMVSPVKLMTFSLADLRAVAAIEGGATDAATAARGRAILQAHGLLTQADLATVPAFLSQLGVATAPLFQGLGLNDLIALADLPAVATPDDGGPDAPTSAQAAAGFALDQARTAEEFGDYYRAYLALAAKMKAAGNPPAQWRDQAQAAVQTLAPLMFGALDCPQVPGLVSPGEVARAVGLWLRQGGRIGFSRLSEGVCRVIDSTTYTNETGSAAQQTLNLYLTNAQSFLAANYPQTGRISQDGRSCVLPAQSGNLYAELLLGPGGGITLRQFRRMSPPPETS